MDDTLKFYLLAEESGWDCSTYAFEYGRDIRKSSAYQLFSYNVIEARKHISYRAKAIVKSYESFRPDPLTVQDAFVLDSQLNYLALHSFPEFYINPLSLDPNYQGEVSTIGDLMFEYEGKEVPLNEIILDENHSAEVKKEDVRRQLDTYLKDMNMVVDESQKIIRKRAFSEINDTKGRMYAILEAVLVFLLNLALLVLFCLRRNDIMQYYYQPDPSIITTYLMFLYPVSVLTADFFFALFHTYKARISEPFNYAKRFLKKNSASVYEDIAEEKERLFDYIAGAINNRITLKNDIHDFSKLSSSYVDFDAVLNVSHLREKKLFKTLHALNFAFLTITSIIGIVFLVVLLLSVIFGIIV